MKDKNPTIPSNKIGLVKPREIVEEMQDSYLDYAMSVIVSRALPDVRDGLKPVQRRILYTMLEEGLRSSAKFRKSATVVGSTLGRYHPHGDQSVYDAMARMAQDFSLRYPLIHGQGNWGCFTKDTEVRLTDGRNLSFENLIKEQQEGKRHWTFAFNFESRKIEITEIKKPRLTRKKEKIAEVILDNGSKIKCTPDHLFMTRDGSYKRARDLKAGDSLMPFYADLYNGEDKNLKGYEVIYQPIKENKEFTHRLADEWNLKNRIYAKSAGKVRHHQDFTKTNNNPDNILRIQWQDHWKYHKEISSERHKNDLDYVRKLAEGRKKFIEEHREVFSQRAKNLNKILWQDPVFRKNQSENIKKLWRDPEYRKRMANASRENLKNLWKKKEFRELLSSLKSEEMKKRWKNKDYRTLMSRRMRQLSLKLWSTPAHRKYIPELIIKRFNKLEPRERAREIMKALWQNPDYRSKFPKEHFRKMAKKLWADTKTQELFRQRALQQWKSQEFRKKFIAGVVAANERRIRENPNSMNDLAQKAAVSLHKNWQSPIYKEKVIKSKILGYARFLLEKYEEITPEIYEKNRTNNGVPSINNTLNYFNDFSEITAEVKERNHKVIKISLLPEKEDVYDLTTEPWHNFVLSAGVFVHNSIDDPSEYAAMRYTEAKLSKIGEELLRDIEKNTVNFIDNFDGTRKEPTVLPSPLPQLLLNGSLGIAVGMATDIPTHNLTELCDALIFLIDNQKATTEDLFKFIKGPDFPTGGIIFDQKEILQAYSQGKGPIVVRGKVDILEQEKTGRQRIIISEIPFRVQKSNLVEQLASLVQEKKIEGIKDIRDESDKDGMRIVMELGRDAYPQKVLNRLYKFSDLQKTFHLNMLALVDGIQPRVLNLVEILNYFILHRKEVVARRTKYDLERAKDRAHILEGLHKCLANIDAVIRIIKNSANREDAQKKLMARFKLSQIQANAILETKLAALAKLERKKIEDELKEIRNKIKELTAILKSPQRIKDVIKKELKTLREVFGDERKTKVNVQKVGEIAEEDLIPQEETIITLTQGGYIKRINPKTYKIQKRGGKGILGMKTMQDDTVEHFLMANTHDSLLFFTDSGKVFRTPVYEIPEGQRVARGRGLLNFLEISPQEKILSLLPLGKDDVDSGTKYLVMITKNGIIKKTSLKDFENVRKSGLIAITLKKDDLLKKVCKSTGQDEILLVSRKGMSIRFKEKDIREMGRTAAGIKGIRLKKGDEVVGMDLIRLGDEKAAAQNYLLVVTENGFGKRTDLKEYRLQGRGGSGIKTANITPKTGQLVFSTILDGREEDLIVISKRGQIIRTQTNSIAKLSRSTQGVRIMRLEAGDKVASAGCT